MCGRSKGFLVGNADGVGAGGCMNGLGGGCGNRLCVGVAAGAGAGAGCGGLWACTKGLWVVGKAGKADGVGAGGRINGPGDGCGNGLCMGVAAGAGTEDCMNWWMSIICCCRDAHNRFRSGSVIICWAFEYPAAKARRRYFTAASSASSQRDWWGFPSAAATGPRIASRTWDSGPSAATERQHAIL